MGSFEAFQHRNTHGKKQFTLREPGLAGALPDLSCGERLLCRWPCSGSGSCSCRGGLSPACETAQGNDVWGGGDERDIFESSAESLQVFQKSAQCSPEPQEKPWSRGRCSLSSRTRSPPFHRRERKDPSGFHLGAFSQSANQLAKASRAKQPHKHLKEELERALPHLTAQERLCWSAVTPESESESEAEAVPV